MTEGYKKKPSRDEMGPDVNYLKPGILETSNRILLDIKHIIEAERESRHPITISAFYFNKNQRTFHSHLVWGSAPWNAKKELDQYAAIPLSRSKYLAGLTYCALADRALLPDGVRNWLALLAVDVDPQTTVEEDDRVYPTKMTPYLWEADYRTLKKSSCLPDRPQLPSGTAAHRNKLFDDFSKRFYLDELTKYLAEESERNGTGASTGGRCALVVPVFDIWDAGRGGGGLWGVLICSFANEAGRESYLSGPQDRQLLDLLLETERLSEEYFSAGLSKIANEKISPPYDLINLFVSRLHWIQDWDRVTVLERDQIQFCYRHISPNSQSDESKWAVCGDKSSGRCVACRKGSRGNPVFRWSSIDPPSDSIHPILNNHLIKEMSSLEELALASIDIEFEFPAYAIVKGSDNGQIDRHFRLAIARQHVAVLRTMLPIVRTRRAALRSAVSAIMGRNMSHNIGSHVLARYASKAKRDLNQVEEKKSDHRGDFLAYLQRRMDFLAEVATSDRAFWSQPLSLKEQLLRLNYGEQQRRISSTASCDHNGDCNHHLSPSTNSHEWRAGRPILLSFITGKESLLASVEYGKPERCNASSSRPASCTANFLPGRQEDFWFACPGGEVGIHALYVVLENIIRNSARHGAASDDTVRLFVSVEDDAKNPELLTIEIIDPRTKLDFDGCPLIVNENVAPERKYSVDEIAKQIGRLGPKPGLLTDGKREKLCSLPAEINDILANEPFLDTAGAPNPHYWGVREIQICAHYLRSNSLSDLEGMVDDAYPVLEAGCYALPDNSFCLKYKFYLQRAKLMLAVVARRDQAWNDIELRRRGIIATHLGNFCTPTWAEVSKLAAGFSFLAIDTEIPRPANANEAERATLPVRTIHCKNIAQIIDQARSNEGNNWMEPLHKIWAEQHRDKRDAWKGKPIWGVAVQADSLHGPLTEMPLSQKDGLIRVAKGSDGGRIVPLPDHLEAWHDSLASANIASAWVDHGNEGDFGRAFACLAQSYKMQSSNVRQWISAEAAFSDSPHSAYLNSSVGKQWEILAAAIPRVAVLDERVQSEFHTGDFRGINLGRIVWPAMGVWVPEKIGSAKCDLDSPDFNQCREFLMHPANHEGQYPIDFLILHLTVLERLGKAMDKSLDNTLLELIAGTQANSDGIIIVTGRGVPTVASSATMDHLLSNVRYLPVSALLESLVARPSKLTLMRAVWSAGRPQSKQ